MDSTTEVNTYEDNYQKDHYANLAVKSYTICIKHRWFPFIGRFHKCYRHEVSDTGHLVLYRIDGTQIALPVAKRSWLVYANYWDFMNQFKNKLRS